MTAIGVRNKNPLNIRPSDKFTWLGQTGDQGGFCTFEDFQHGIRAAAINLRTYVEKHRLTTVPEIISRWAPPGDDNDTLTYIANVCSWTGYSAERPIDARNWGDVLTLLQAMARMELGADHEQITELQWEQGLRLAGLARKKPLTQSRTITRNATAAAGVLGLILHVLADKWPQFSELVGALVPLLPQFVAALPTDVVSALAAVGGVIGVFMSRADDRNKERL